MTERRQTTRRVVDVQTEFDRQNERIDKALETANKALSGIESHERLCSERYQRLDKSVSMLIKLSVGVLIAIVTDLLIKAV